MISSLELARLCGVSQGTVDRALHDRPGVSPATRKRVLEVAEKHGYRPNPAVLEVMHGKSRIVGGVVPAFASLFFADLMQALARALEERGLRLLVAQAASEEEFHERLGDFAARRASGAVVVPPGEDIRLRADAAGMPVVTLATSCVGKNARFVSPDERLTGATATRHLLERGHHRIAHVTYARKARGVEQRKLGYREAMSAAGLEARVLIEPDAEALVDTVRRERITALFCHNDWQALAAIRALTAAGLAVPAEVSVIGVDASPSFVAVYPGITTLRYPFEELGAIAAATVAGEKPRGGTPQCVLLPGTTVGPPPA